MHSYLYDTCTQTEELKTQNTNEGNEDAGQYFIGERSNNRDRVKQPEYHWDTKSYELRCLRHQACWWLMQLWNVLTDSELWNMSVLSIGCLHYSRVTTMLVEIFLIVRSQKNPFTDIIGQKQFWQQDSLEVWIDWLSKV